jgi:hypothetical protein
LQFFPLVGSQHKAVLLAYYDMGVRYVKVRAFPFVPLTGN